MEKLTSTKAILITLAIAGIILLVFNIMSRNKEKTMQNQGGDQNTPQTVQPKPDMKELEYTAITPSASGTRVVKLTLQGQDATMKTVFLTGEPEIVESGTFTRAGDFITVLLTDKDGQKAQVPQDLTFNVTNKEELNLLNPEAEGYGAEGLVLGKPNKALASTSWYWQETLMNNDSRIAPSDPKQFKLTFADLLQFSTTTDCNSGSGTYHTSGNNIAFGPIATTNMYCEGSVETEYYRDLGQVQSFMIEGDKLVFMLPYDSGTMVFSKAPATQ